MEQNINKTNIDYIPLQAVASASGCEQLETNQDVGQKTNTEHKPQTDKPKRCSGAARRRFKKQRRLMEALRNQNPPPKFLSVTPLLKVTQIYTGPKEISSPKATLATDPKEVNLPEAAAATGPKEVSLPEATSVTGFKEVSLPEVTSATGSKEINPSEATSAIDPKEVVSLPKTTSATDPKEVSPPEVTSAIRSYIGPQKVSAPTNELKRIWSMHEIPNSSNNSPDKKHKNEHIDQNWVKNIIKMAVVLEGFPEKRFDVNDISFLKKNITRRILELDKDIKAPTFTGMWEKDGAIIVHCVNEYSKNCLKNMCHGLYIKEVPVHVIQATYIFKRYRVSVLVTDPEISAEEVLKLFDRQNEGLNAEEWIIAKKSERRDTSRSYFIASISGSSLEALKAINFKPFCGLVRATVKLLKEENNQ